MTIIVGHRGAGRHAPENTLLSFKTAIKQGLAKTGLDVHLSKDGQVIVIHDDNVDRTTDGHGKIARLTLAEIKKLNCASGQKIPTLQEVIDLCKGKIDLHIELKAKGTPKPVCKLFLKNGLTDRIVVISFDIKLIKEIKKINPKIVVGYLFHRYSKRVWSYVQTVPLEYICPLSTIVTEEMITRAHFLNLKVHAWKVNEKPLGKKLIKMGVDSLGTDYPELFL